MGTCFSSLSKQSNNHRGVLFLGLDGAGSTSILYQLVLKRRLKTIPTLGLNHEILNINDLTLECWDIGGLENIRPLWKNYYQHSDAVVFTVDSSDRRRMQRAAWEIEKLYGEDRQQRKRSANKPLLIFANKQDHPKAMNADTVEQVLGLERLALKNCKVFECSVDDRQSLLNGIQWLTTVLKKHR